MIAAIAGPIARAFPPLQRRAILPPSSAAACFVGGAAPTTARSKSSWRVVRDPRERTGRLLEACPWGFRQVPFRWDGRHAWSEGCCRHGDLLQSTGRLRCDKLAMTANPPQGTVLRNGVRRRDLLRGRAPGGISQRRGPSAALRGPGISASPPPFCPRTTAGSSTSFPVRRESFCSGRFSVLGADGAEIAATPMHRAESSTERRFSAMPGPGVPRGAVAGEIIFP